MTLDVQNQPMPVPDSVPLSGPRKRRYKGRRNPHLGVTIVRPSAGQVAFRLRWKSPDTGRFVFRKLSDQEARSEDTRRDAAIRQWQELQDRKLQLNTGAEKYTAGDTLIRAAIEGYFTGPATRLAARTQQGYRSRISAFLAWLETPAVNVRKCGQVNARLLRAYRSHVIARNTLDGTKRRVSDATVNAAMWACGAVLGELAKGQEIPMTASAVTEALETVKDRSEKKDFLRPAQLRAILAACIAYDADTSIRSEIRGRMYATILLVMLTGMRSQEALRLEWRDIGEDPDGRPCIHVRREIAKNGRARRIYLAHSPLLAHLVGNRRGRADNARVVGVARSVLATARYTIAAKLGLAFDCKVFRRTCGTFLTCAPNIFGAAAPYMSAQQLGHTVEVAQKNYLGLVQVDRAHTTTEAAMDLQVNLSECPQL